jgi:hypothetical protein
MTDAEFEERVESFRKWIRLLEHDSIMPTQEKEVDALLDASYQRGVNAERERCLKIIEENFGLHRVKKHETERL